MIIVILAITVIGALIIAAGTAMRPTIQAWVQEDTRSRLTMVIAVLIGVASGPPIALALYLWRFGSRVVTSGRFPPPGARLMQDTPVVAGDAARRRGRTLQIFAAMVAGSALLIAVMLARLAMLVWTSAA